jgi:hypothetical protein
MEPTHVSHASAIAGRVHDRAASANPFRFPLEDDERALTGEVREHPLQTNRSRTASAI